MRMPRKTVYYAISALAVSLLPITAQAASSTWTGTTSGAWEQKTNWGAAVAYPNSYSDQATIPYLAARPTVSLSSAVLLGGGGTALTISAKSSNGTVNALDITSSGLLGMQGGISIGARRTMTIEGTLRNDAASSATAYTISGSPIMNGGTLSSLNGGVWNLSSGIGGYGTISAPITTAGNISATVANQTLHVTGDVTSTSQRGIGNGSYVSGAVLSIEGGHIIGGMDNYNKVNMRGTFDNVVLYSDGGYNTANPGGWNSYNLTGNSSWNNGALNIMNFNGYKMDMTGTVTNYAGYVDKGVNVGSGTLNNPGSSVTTILNAGLVTLAGGSITGAAGSQGFSFGTNVRVNGGNNTISTPVTITPNGSLAVSNNSNLTIKNTTLTNSGGATISNESGSTVHVVNSTVNWGNFANNGAYISDPSTQTFSTLTVGSTGYLTGATGDIFKITGDFINNSAENNAWNTLQAALAFATGTATTHKIALGGADLGRTSVGFTNNFAWNSLDLSGQTLILSDGNATSGGALYVSQLEGLTFDSTGSTVTDIIGNGFNIYYDPSADLALGGKTFNLEGGGILAPDTAPVPEPGTLMLLGAGFLGLAVCGKRRKNV
jgi:hypothetical protein